MSVEAVVFDWGGTLTPWHDIDLVEQWRAYADALQPVVADPRVLARRLMAAELAQWRGQQSSSGANGTGTLEHIFASAGVDTSVSGHGPALAAYLAAWEPHTLADPDALPLLAALRERGLRIGVLSNTMWPRAHHEAVFARDGLTELIDAAVYSSEIPVAKPHADAFQAVLTALDVDPAAAVFVGDRPWDDVHGAQSVGMRAILIPHSRLGDQAVDIDVVPDAVVAGLSEVGDVVGRWMEA